MSCGRKQCSMNIAKGVSSVRYPEENYLSIERRNISWLKIYTTLSLFQAIQKDSFLSFLYKDEERRSGERMLLPPDYHSLRNIIFSSLDAKMMEIGHGWNLVCLRKIGLELMLSTSYEDHTNGTILFH